MDTDSDSNSFSDDAIDNVQPNAISFDVNDLLKTNTEEIPIRSNDNVIKKHLKELLDANINPNLNKVITFLLESDDDEKAWSTFASYLRSIPLDYARKGFDILFERFPYSGRFVKMYCEMEEKAKNYDIVKSILRQKLPYCVSIDLWVYYCSFFKQHTLMHKVGRELAKARKEVECAFSYAVDTVGFFIDSDDLWAEYRSFLEEQIRDERDINATGDFTRLRRHFYHRAVVIPFHNLEGIWNEYSTFEESVIRMKEKDPEERKKIVNGQKQLVDEDHKLATDIYKERAGLWQYLRLDNLPMHSLTSETQKQVDYWKKAIEYDLTNPMKLPPEQVYHQIHMTYLRCLSCCYYCPDIWLDFAEFESDYDWKRATQVIESAISAIPDSLFLRFACCDFYELHDHIENAQDMFEIIVKDFPCALSWIMYQRFVRRQQGIEASRQLFNRARKALNDPQIYIAAAELERDVNCLPDVGLNIYRVGMNYFNENTEFILKFADALINEKQVELVTKLIQDSIVKVKSNEDKQKLWDKLIEIKARFSILQPIKQVLQVEEEMRKEVPDDKNSVVLVDLARYTLWGCSFSSKEDLSFLKRRYPDVKKEVEEEHVKRFEASIDLVPIDTTSTIGRNKTELPQWLKDIHKKLPIAKTKYARDSSVDKLMKKMLRVTIPSKDRLYLDGR